jgi:hypothetical protein
MIWLDGVIRNNYHLLEYFVVLYNSDLRRANKLTGWGEYRSVILKSSNPLTGYA